MRVIAAYTNSEQAYLLASRLESADIDVEIRDAATLSLNWMYAFAIGGIKVAVSDEDVDDALAILHLSAGCEGLLKCPSCGSSESSVRVLSPSGAFFLFANIPVPLGLQKADCRSCARSYAISAHPHWSAPMKTRALG